MHLILLTMHAMQVYKLVVYYSEYEAVVQNLDDLDALGLQVHLKKIEYC